VNGSPIPGGNITYYGNTLTPNSLQYYIVAREVDKVAGSNLAKVYFLQQRNYNNVQVPQNIIYNDLEYYTGTNADYYRYFDIAHFLSEIENGINTVLGADATHLTYMINNSSAESYQLLISSDATKNYVVDFSSSLINLFYFKHIEAGYLDAQQLLYSPLTLTIRGLTYLETDCLYRASIFPFRQLLFISDDIGLNPINFIDNSILESNNNNQLFSNAILSFDIGTGNINFYDFFEYVNNFDSIFSNFRVDKLTTQSITIKIFLRLENNLLIPYQLSPNDLFTFSLELKYDD